MIINILNKISASVILFLALSSGGRATRNEIKEATHSNNVPIDNSLNQLLNLKMLNQKDKLLSLNMENLIIQQIIKEIKDKFSFLPLQIQFILTEFIENSLNARGINEIILFGNYSKPVHQESSIELAVIFKDTTKNLDRQQKKILRVAENLSKENNKTIKISFLPEQKLKSREDISRGIYLL